MLSSVEWDIHMVLKRKHWGWDAGLYDVKGGCFLLFYISIFSPLLYLDLQTHVLGWKGISLEKAFKFYFLKSLRKK